MKTRRQRGGWPWSRKNKPTTIVETKNVSNAGVKNLKEKNNSKTMKYTKINVEATHNGFNKEKANANNANRAANNAKRAANNAEKAKANAEKARMIKTSAEKARLMRRPVVPNPNWTFRFSPPK